VCGEASLDFSSTWLAEWPSVEGTYLWIETFSCGCVLRSGIAEVYPDYDDEAAAMRVAWGACEPNYFDGKPQIHWWARIELPGARD
jgi:hypothetical protein